MAEAQAQPYENDPTSVILTMIFGQLVIPVQSVTLHEAERTSDD